MNTLVDPCFKCSAQCCTTISSRNVRLLILFYTCVFSTDTAATLSQLKEIPTGIHEVDVMVTDLQGSGDLQTVKVRICQCRDGVCLAKASSVSLGPLGILALLLPLALLLLLCESSTAILLPAELCRPHCVDKKTRSLRS